MEWVEVKKENERNILMALKDGDISQSELAEKLKLSKRWIRKKLNDLRSRNLLKEKIKKGERIVGISKNVKFVEEKNYAQSILPLIPSMVTFFFCLFLFLVSLIFLTQLINLIFLFFMGSFASFAPSLLWIFYKTKSNPGYFRVYEKIGTVFR